MAITRYRVEGKLAGAATEAVRRGLQKNAIAEIDNEAEETATGWTSFESPFFPSFEGSSFLFGPLYVFSMRVDRKSVSAKLIRKHLGIAVADRLAKTKKQFLSKDEKTALKENVLKDLLVRMPSTPSVYDLAWDYEHASVFFFSTLRAANEKLEGLFKRSFNLGLIRIFPFTAADSLAGLSDSERDVLIGLSSTQFSS
ncbi:MAG: recombination-associated protein RdgC [Desulfobacterales bacterium]|jgi:DNA recombination-dependent growth factor C|nr:recombination-associated protein RdgC [Desulfobacterales bacterium]